MKKQYRKKPVVIEAWRVNDDVDTWDAIAVWCGGVAFPSRVAPSGTVYGAALEITTLEGVMSADVGDWVIRGVQGEFYPCKPSIFDATYEPATTEDQT